MALPWIASAAPRNDGDGKALPPRSDQRQVAGSLETGSARVRSLTLAEDRDVDAAKGGRWDDFFAETVRLSEDFLIDREQLVIAEREAF